MRYEVTLPNLGDDSIESATISIWLADEGDIVSEDDDLVEMTTDKATFTVPSPKTGLLKEKLVEEDEEVNVGDVLCVLEI
jgi:pyruvate/2-oxoglutarate dehydrogenase complex dihydrolipoamide acyltransferase (E2) component